MSSPFNIKKTTQVGRNGFDLTQRHLFNAAPGMLLPIMCEPTLPGDSFRIGLDSFTRMRPLNTAAFARFKEYFDFYWVSKDTLWPYYNSMVVNNNEPQTLPNVSNSSVPQMVPNCKDIDLASLFHDTEHYSFTDDFGFSYGKTSSILFDLLGYGNSYLLYNRNDDPVSYDGQWVSLLPWCAYQRIYADFYRNPQWERRDVSSYNLRPYYSSTNHLYLAQELSDYHPNMFKMRYANWEKDYFMGLYPSQQFGDVSVVGSASTGFTLGSTLSSGGSPRPLYTNNNSSSGLAVAGTASPSTQIQTTINSELSIVDLRRAQALQRWKEVTMTNGSSMYQQIKAHYGFELPEGRKDAPEYVGGFDNIVTIGDIYATATSDNALNDKGANVGEIFGKATAASDPRKVIEYTAKDFGYFMCIYHVKPKLEYDATGTKRSNLCLTAADEYIPEFDRIGFGRVNRGELYQPSSVNAGIERTDLLGYSSRYLDLKASYDRVHGSFIRAGNVGVGPNDGAWTIALSQAYFDSLQGVAGQESSIDYRFFKIPPTIANNIMQVTIDGGVLTPSQFFSALPFMVSANFNLYKTSNMSVDSLPY